VVNHTNKIYEAQSAETTGLEAAVQGSASTGSSLFVINLCASIAPVAEAGRNLPGLENYRLYQVARVEDGRTRHRLRLGFFTSESHAEGVLTVVRQQYPTAFMACLGDEDRKFTRGFLPTGSTESAAAAPKPAIAIVSNKDAEARTLPTQSQLAPQVNTAPQSKAGSPASVPRKAPIAPSDVVAAISAAIDIVIDEGSDTRAATLHASAAAGSATDSTLVAAGSEIIELTWEPSLEKAPDGSAASSQPGPAGQPWVSAAQSESIPIATALSEKPASAAVNGTPAPGPIDASPNDASALQDAAGWDRSVLNRPIQPLLDLSFSDPPPVSSQPARDGPVQPFHVGQHVDIGDIGISLQSDPRDDTVASTPAMARSTPAPAAAHTSRGTPPAAATDIVRSRAVDLAGKPAATVTPLPTASVKAVSPRPACSAPPELDSTQTIRALTLAELEDDQLEKWFSIQLAASEQPVNLDAMPHLDIFQAYRLYSVAGTIDGKIVHSLRLGFFKEEVSAEAVGGYLKTFFAAPTVLRVSEAEYTRFKEPRVRPGPTMQEAKVIDLSQARTPRGDIPVVTMEVPTPSFNPHATGTFRAHVPALPDPNAEQSFDPRNTGSFRAGATGSFKTNDSESSPPGTTGAFKAGTGAAAKPAARTAAKAATPAARRSALLNGAKGGKTGTTGRHKAMAPRSLSQELLEEARAVQLSESAVRKLPRHSSLLSRLVGKLTR